MPRFEYGYSHMKDIEVKATRDKIGEAHVQQVLLDGRPVEPSKRFWSSLHHRFGFTQNIFRYFSHEEVFQRISTVAANDRVRWCLEVDNDGSTTLLAVSNPAAALIRHDDLTALLTRYETEDIVYSKGIVTSQHAPRNGSTFAIAGDDFQNRYVLDTPIDGFGRPSLYLSMLRLICSNGAIAYSPTFRSEVNMGKSGANAEYALVRVLDGFNNEEGYAALRQRFEAATRSWASVNEVNSLYRALVRLLHNRDLRERGSVKIGHDGAQEPVQRSALLRSFYQLTGDLPEMYGLANLDALSVKRQRTLPSACKVYDVLNFMSETATHHATADGNRVLQAHLGELIASEYDLEGTVDQFGNWRDFFIGHDATTSTLASLQGR